MYFRNYFIVIPELHRKKSCPQAAGVEAKPYEGGRK